MSTIDKRVEFAVIIKVNRANVNGNPLNDGRPHVDDDGFGEMTDVCLKRKIRNWLLFKWVTAGKNEDDGNMIIVQSNDQRVDEHTSLKKRAQAFLGNKLGSGETVELACSKWYDVRAFGHLFALPSKKKNKAAGLDEGQDESGVSIGIRGPVTIWGAKSVEPVRVVSIQITKSANADDNDAGKKGPDTMGWKHWIEKGVYVFYGSINPYLAEKTGFSNADAETLKDALINMFRNDESSARPAGSMEVVKVIWWEHNSKLGQYSPAKVHRTLTVNPDGSFQLNSLDGLVPQILEGY